MREIITVQFGEWANYTGATYWNAQQSYFTYPDVDPNGRTVEADEPLVNHDVSFRAGQALNGSQTYTPRCLVYDIKNNFGSLRTWNGEYTEPNISPGHGVSNVWTSKLNVSQTANLIEPSSYTLALNAGHDHPVLTDKDVRYWSDYLEVNYHPKSLVELSSPDISLLGISSNTNYDVGDLLWKCINQADQNEGFHNNLRNQLEECDGLQGIQIFGELTSAWGKVVGKSLECIHDDLGSKVCIWTWGGDNTKSDLSTKEEILQSLHLAQSLESIIPHTSIIVTLGTPHSPTDSMLIPNETLFQRSAIQAMAMESISFPNRAKSPIPVCCPFSRYSCTQNASMWDLTSTLTYGSSNTPDGDSYRNISRLSMQLEHRPDTWYFDGVNSPNESSLVNDSDGMDKLEVFSQINVARGQVYFNETSRGGQRFAIWRTNAEIGGQDKSPRYTYRSPISYSLSAAFPHTFNLRRNTSNCGHVALNVCLDVSSSTYTQLIHLAQLMGSGKVNVLRDPQTVVHQRYLAHGLFRLNSQTSKGVWSQDVNDTVNRLINIAHAYAVPATVVDTLYESDELDELS